jgi:tetratricopeptide (TPR) repeat protein
MRRRQLFLNHDAAYDWLIALEHGRVDDGTPEECWRVLGDLFAYLLDEPGGQVVGFRVNNFSQFDVEEDLEALEAEAGGRRPRFDVPTLMLFNAPAAEIVPAAREFFEGESSINRDFFDRAVECNAEELSEQELYWWRQCLQVGDAMAHFGIGYTLYDLGHYEEAATHLRHYATLAPNEPWVLVWLGKGEQALGNDDEARAAYERAIELTEAGAQETDAPELLGALLIA